MRRIAAFATLAFTLFTAFPASRAVAASVGAKAPAFELPDLAGKNAAYAAPGEVTFVNFWATWCAPCAVEFPKLNELAVAYKGKVRVLAISVDEENPNRKIEAFLKKRAAGKVELSILLDKNLKVAESYGVEAMPTSFIIDKDGVIRFIHTGFDVNDPAVWKAELDSLLK